MDFEIKKPKKEDLVETVRERLERLKSEEEKPKPKHIRFDFEIKKESIATNIPEHNIEIILDRMEKLERKMNSDSGNYLGFFYDLKAMEEKFLNELDKIKRNNLQISEELLKKIQRRKTLIDKKLNQ